jgi:hypothetical protein
MSFLRLGDDIEDYCVKCKRVTDHSVLAIVNEKPAKVRCRTCYHEQEFRNCVVPPSKKDLKKAALFQAVLDKLPGSEAPAGEAETKPDGKKPKNA